MRGALAAWLVIVAAACIAPSTLADDAGTEAARIFEAGNEYYAAGDFEQAARNYRQLLNQGFLSAAVNYNLGNALFKMNRLGPAILQYEKALRLGPGDPDIRANLEYLRTLTADRATVAGALTTTFFVERIFSLTSLEEDAAALTVAWLVMSALIGLWIAARSERLRRAAIWGMAVSAIPLLVTGGGFALKVYRDAAIEHAIVLEEKADVKSGPGSENTTLFSVHEGLKVRIRNHQGSWAQVSLESGLNGWVPVSALGTI